MSWKLQFTATARREITKLNLPLKQQLEEDLQELAADPSRGKFLHGRLKGARSWRSGDYRILYGVQPQEEVVVVYRIAHRREAYR